MIDEPERTRAFVWYGVTVALVVLLQIVALALALPAHALLFGLAQAEVNPLGIQPGLSANWLDWTSRYLEWLYTDRSEAVRFLAVWGWGLSIGYFDIAWTWRLDPLAAQGLPSPALIATAMAGLGLAMAFGFACPYSTERKSHGSAAFADDAFCRKNGLYAPTGMILGAVGGRIFKLPQWLAGGYRSFGHKWVRNWETLSALVISPPGTGKTVLLQSNILADWPDPPGDDYPPGPCMIINDPKGELHDKTGGWRSRVGKVFKLAWGEAGSARWNPMSPSNYRGGTRIYKLRQELKARLQPFFVEPKGLEEIRAEQAKLGETQEKPEKVKVEPGIIGQLLKLQKENPDNWRELFVAEPEKLGRLLPDADRDVASAEIAACLPVVQDLITCYDARESYIDRMTYALIPQQPNNPNSHFDDTGRAALLGWILLTMARSDRLTEVEGKWVEPTFTRLLQWITDATVDTETGETGETENEDAIFQMLTQWIEEAKAYGYSPRVEQELVELRTKPDRERGSVVSTAVKAINIFKSASVQEATSVSDFTFDDLRGMDLPHPLTGRQDPRGVPVTVYIVVSLEDAEKFGKITGLFLEGLAAYLISQKEKDIKKKRPAMFMLDEFWTLPKLNSLQQIPALGRGQWVQLMAIGQSNKQIAQKNGQEAVSVLKSAMAYSCSFTQNDHADAKEISETIGNRTVVTPNVSKTEGMGKGANPWQANKSRSATGLPLMRPEDIMSMEKLDPKKGRWGQMLVLVQGMRNRPIKCRPPVFFVDSTMRQRVGLEVINWSPDGGSEAPAAAGGGREVPPAGRLGAYLSNRAAAGTPAAANRKEGGGSGGKAAPVSRTGRRVPRRVPDAA